MPPFTSPPDPIIFNNQVWDLVRQIPPGKVATYGQIAKLITPLQLDLTAWDAMDGMKKWKW